MSWRLTGRGGIASCIPNLGTGWKWAISFMSWPLFTQ
jgi:hypothetical protein